MNDHPSTPNRLAHAAGDDWSVVSLSVVEQLGPLDAGGRVGFVYLTDSMAGNVDAVVDALRAGTGITDWIGTVGVSVFADAMEYSGRPAMAALTMAMPKGTYRLFTDVGQCRPPEAAAVSGYALEVSMPVGIVHADPRSDAITDMLRAAAEESGAFIIGGLASSRGEHAHIAGGRVMRGGMSGVVFDGNVRVQTGLSQGCSPLGPAHQVTEGSDTVIMAIDGRRPLDVLSAEAGERVMRDLRDLAEHVHVAFHVTGSDRRDYLVRTLVGIDPLRGWIAVGERVAVGDRIAFVRRDPDSARQDLAAMTADLRSRLPGPARGALYFSCVARGRHMFGAPGAELSVLRSQLGDVPLIGFSCAGEISNARLYGYTGVLAVFT
jgi:small ligand-binding sensory domain FIST